MSGHSKWATIKRKKGAADAKRSNMFAKLLRAVEVAAREGGAEDLSDEGSSWDIVTAPHEFKTVEGALERAGVTVESAEISMIPTTTIPVDGGDARHVLQLIDALEELDDVQNVYANFDIPEDVMASL